MAAKLHVESRRLYSWWWDSHISPKNSKWLQENLADTDMKVNTIIKLLEEDADSFARRAEMYYKKRPELMKLVEELYRAYRALAEKYDNATGALCQAHRTMAEAFPNQIPLILLDESPHGSSGNEAEPHTPEVPPPFRALLGPDDLQKDALSLSLESHIIKRNGAYAEQSGSLSSKKGLKQLNEMFAIGDGAARTTSEARARKGLIFQEEEGETVDNKTQKWSREKNQVKEKQDASYAAKGLQQDICHLSAEIQNLKNQIMAESDRANKAENELQSLKDTISKLIAEKDADHIQYQISLERISDLESHLSTTQNELKELNDEMLSKVKKLQSTKELNHSLLLEVEMLRKKVNKQEHELILKQEELEKLLNTIEHRHQQCMQTGMVVLLKEKLHTQSQEEVNHSSQEIQKGINKLRDMLLCNVDLQEQIFELKEENGSLNEQNLDSTLVIKELQDKIILLDERKRILEDEVGLLEGEKEILNQELCHIKEDRNGLEGKHRDLIEEVVAVSTHAESLETTIKDLQNEISKLNGICKKHEAEKELLLKNMDNVLEKNVVLENSLSDANIELEVLREKIIALEELCGSLNNEISTYVSRVEILTQDVNTLSDKNTFLENTLSDLCTEVGCLRSKLATFEESCHSLSDQNSGLLAERDSFLSQVEILIQNVEKLSDKNSFLENSLSDLTSEVGCLRSKLKETEESSQILGDRNCGLLAERNAHFSQVEILTQNMEMLSDKNSLLENALSVVSGEVDCLRSQLKDSEKSCQSLGDQKSGLLAENNTLLSEVEVLTQNVEKLSDKNFFLENSLSDLTIEVGCLRSKLKDSEESFLSLNDQNSGFLAEKAVLVSQVEVLAENMEKLSCKNSFLENSLSDVNSEVGCLRSKLRDFEESCQSLRDQNSGLLSERSTLLSQVEILTQNVEKLSEKNSFLDNSLTDVISEVGCLRSKLKDSEESAQSLSDLNSGFLSQIEILTQTVEKLSDKNSFLENSLADISTEGGCLRSKLKDFEESCQSLHDQNSCLLAERNNLLSQVEILTQNVEKLADKNSFLENSLSDVSTEAGCLKSKFKDFEESCQHLRDQNSSLLVEKNTLVSQIESITLNLEILESRFADLKDKHSKLTREKDLIINQVKDLQDLLKLEKEEHETLIQSYKSQLATLENQNFLLQQENQLKDNELEAEHTNLIGALIENFILQRSLSDVNGRNLALSIECQKHLQACRNAETLISELEQEKLMHIKNILLLSEQKEKLSNGIHLLRNILKTDKEFGSLDDIHDEVDIILGEIKKLLDFISESEGDNQQLHLEISVLVTLLRHMILDLVSLRLEKRSLQRELDIKTEELLALENKKLELLGLNENLMKDVEVSNQREAALKTEMMVLYEQLIDLKEALHTCKCEILNLIEEKKILVEEFYNLSQKHNMLEGEHAEVLAEAMELSHLYLFFKNLSAERLLELKSFSYDLDSLHVIKNGLDAKINKPNEKIRILKAEKMHLRESITCLGEDFKNHLLLSEFDLITATNVYEELNLQRQSIDNQLVQKQKQLLETNLKVQSTQQKNLDLCRILEGLQLDNEASKLVKEELEHKVSALSEAVAHRDDEIRCLQEANEMLHEEINQMCEEVKVLMSREEDLISELQKEIAKNECCEGEITALLSDIQVSTVNAALYEDKFHELILVGQVTSILQKEMLKMEVALTKETKEYVDNLKKKTDELEGENNELKAVLDVYLSLVTSLWNGITSLETQIRTMSKVRPSNNHDKEDLSLVSHWHHVYSQPSEDHDSVDIKGIPELETLISKVKALEKVIIDTKSYREKERFDASPNLEAATKGIEGLNKKELAGQPEEGQASQNSVRQMYDDEGLNDAEISRGKHGQMMKDIQLDQDSSSLHYRTIGSYGLRRINSVEIDDQLWEAAERDCSNGTWKASIVAKEHDIEPVEEEKSEYPSSELAVEKELSVDKLEIPNRALSSQQEWTRRVCERLQTDAQKLSALKINVKDLKRKMESSQMGKLPASFGYDTTNAQLKDAEGALMELIDTNNKLTNNTEEYHFSDGMGTKSEESGSARRRQISEKVRTESEKVGRLELELHKIQYVLLKLEEEHLNRHTKGVDRTRILLRDFVYGRGRRDGHRQMRKSSFCGCMRPATKGDH